MIGHLTDKPIVAIGQIQSRREPRDNLIKTERAATDAVAIGAAMLVLPEYLMSWGPGRHDRAAMAEVAEDLDGRFVSAISAIAARNRLWLVAGVIERHPDGDRPFNTTVILDHGGHLRGVYRKTHLFDAFTFRESAAFVAGDTLFEPIDSPIGRIGLFVCYELRFPEVAASQVAEGAEVLIVPSGWVAGNHKDNQWRSLIKARAIENGTYVVAAAQAGNEFMGRSLLVNPMGEIVREAGDGEELIHCEIDLESVSAARALVPSLQHRRLGLYRTASGTATTVVDPVQT